MRTDGIQPGDLPPACRPLAEAIGIEAFLQIVALYGGCTLYIPTYPALARAARDRRIRRAYRGDNVRALAQLYGLSARQIRNILRAGGVE